MKICFRFWNLHSIYCKKPVTLKIFWIYLIYCKTKRDCRNVPNVADPETWGFFLSDHRKKDRQNWHLQGSTPYKPKNPSNFTIINILTYNVSTFGLHRSCIRCKTCLLILLLIFSRHRRRTGWRIVWWRFFNSFNSIIPIKRA